MNLATALEDKIAVTKSPSEPGYEAWKLAKVERGLAQAQDRDAMISVDQILSEFGLEP